VLQVLSGGRPPNGFGRADSDYSAESASGGSADKWRLREQRWRRGLWRRIWISFFNF
jgi:hypothetical protein